MGADPNATVSYQEIYDEPDIKPPPATLYTLLMVAIVENNFDAFRLLLERGANPLTHLPNGLTPLKVAARHGKASFCKLLLDRHADFRGSEQNLLEIAVRENDISFFDKLKKSGALPTPLQWPSTFTTLSLPMARRMLAGGANPNVISTWDKPRSLPLLIATQKKDWPLVQFLLENGAKIDRYVLTDIIPNRRLSSVEIQQQEEYLRARWDDPFSDGDEDTETQKEQIRKQLTENKQEDLRGLQLCLKQGAEPNLSYPQSAILPQAKDKRYLTRYTNSPLHIAASNNRKGAVTLLLQA